MKCECGNYLAANIEMEMVCRCGVTHVIKPEKPRHRRVGDIYRDKIRPYLTDKTRRCRHNDAIALMNRWGPTMTDDQLSRIILLMTQTRAEIGQDTIRKVIQDSIEEYNGQDSQC